MSEFKPIVSSNLESAGYSSVTSTLVVRFKNGTKYKYPNVPLTLWQEFEKTFDGSEGRSAGKFFHANFKSLPCEKIEE